MATETESTLHYPGSLSPASLRSPISETFEYEKSKDEQIPVQFEFGSIRLTENWHELNVADRIVAINDVHITKIKDPMKARSYFL